MDHLSLNLSMDFRLMTRSRDLCSTFFIQDADATARFQKINQAYTIMVDGAADEDEDDDEDDDEYYSVSGGVEIFSGGALRTF